MLHELILVCMSISVLITTVPRLQLASGSNSCVTNIFCKQAPGYSNGYGCKTAGGSQDLQTTVYEALNIHYDLWSAD